MLSEHNKQHHRKVLLSNFHPNCPHFIGKNFIQRLSGGEGGGGATLSIKINSTTGTKLAQ